MRNLALIIAFAFISLPSFAQKRNDLQGPKYKNYKPWKHDTKSTVLFVTDVKSELKGPEYKNYKPSKKASKEVNKIVITRSKRSELTGPAYKNYKPWRDNI